MNVSLITLPFQPHDHSVWNTDQWQSNWKLVAVMRFIDLLTLDPSLILGALLGSTRIILRTPTSGASIQVTLHTHIPTPYHMDEVDIFETFNCRLYFQWATLRGFRSHQDVCIFSFMFYETITSDSRLTETIVLV